MHVAASTGRVVAGRYLLQQPIGRGAMGTVWRARDSVLARDVAVKEVRFRGPATPGSARAEDTRVLYERSLREARTAARLNHPAVVTVFDVIEADGCPWIVMELIEARSLEQVLAEDGPLLPREAADLGSRLLSALHAAHQAGILHRDVKPSNVLLGPDDRAVLTDFGIATLEGEPGLTQAGMVMGTPGFTAPERVRGEPATAASDLWSLGATLFAAVEGHGPFDSRGSSMGILAAIANEEAPQPRRAGPLRPAIEALLRRDPRERPDAAAATRLLAVDAGVPGRPAVPGAAVPGAAAPGAAAPEDGTATAPAPGIRGPGSPWLGAPLPAPERRGSESAATLWAAGGDTRTPGWAPLPGGWPAGQAGPQWASPRRAEAAGPLPASLDAGRPERDPLPPPGTPSWTGAGRHGPERDRIAAALAALRPRTRWAGLTATAAVTMICLVLAVLLARAHRPAAVASTAYHTVAVSAATAGSTAGFSLVVPSGWHTAQHGPTTVFTSPGRTAVLRVTPAAFSAPRAVGEARLLQAVALRRGTFPGYQRITLRSARIHGHAGAAWEFTWQPAGGPRAEVRELLFRLASKAGPQGYLVQESAPATAWPAGQALFGTVVASFRALP